MRVCVRVCTILLTSIYSSTHSAPSTTLNLSLTSQKFTSLPRAPSPGSIPPTTLTSNTPGIGRSKTASVPHKRMMTPANDGYIPMLPKARPPLSTVLYPTAVPLPLNPQSLTNQYYSGDDLAPRTPELDPCPEASSEQSRLQEPPTFSRSQLGGTDDGAEHNLSEGLGGNVGYVNVKLGAEESMDLADVEDGQHGGMEYVNIQLGSHQTQPVVSLLCTLLIT